MTTNDPSLLLTPESRKRAESQKPRHQSQSKSQFKSQREPLNLRISRYLKTRDATAAEISAHLEQKRLSGRLKIVHKEMIVQGLIEYAVLDKPRSRLQRYRLTAKGKEWLKG